MTTTPKEKAFHYAAHGGALAALRHRQQQQPGNGSSNSRSCSSISSTPRSWPLRATAARTRWTGSRG
jgi:hypothetical protein